MIIGEPSLYDSRQDEYAAIEDAEMLEYDKLRGDEEAILEVVISGWDTEEIGRALVLIALGEFEEGGAIIESFAIEGMKKQAAKIVADPDYGSDY